MNWAFRLGFILLGLAIVAGVLGAFGVGMAGANSNATPRVNPETVGLLLCSMSGFMLVGGLWSAEPDAIPFWVRVLGSTVLLPIAAWFFRAAFFASLFVG